MHGSGPLGGGAIELDALDRRGAGSYELLWRDEHSEAWLNTWWESKDTGFHDHGGSCVGVHVLEGRAVSEALVVGSAPVASIPMEPTSRSVRLLRESTGLTMSVAR
jgi:hypothetical protein